MVTSELTGPGMALLGVSVVIAVAGLLWAALGQNAHRVARWSARCGLAVTGANRPIVGRYLRRTRCLQIAGAAIGWLASPTYIALTGRPFPLGDSWVVLAVSGYLFGAVVAELSFLMKRQPRPTVRGAALTPRTLSRYIPPTSTWAIRVLPAVTVLLAAIYAVAPRNPVDSTDPNSGFVLVSSIVVVVFATLMDRLLRVIVDRPQPVITSDLLAADEAIRSSSLHSLSAGCIALLMLSIGWVIVSLGGVTTNPQLSELLVWSGLGCDLAALAAWVSLGHLTSWRGERSAPQVI